MIYRCPYCQMEIGEEKLPKCPECKRELNYKKRRTPAQRREDKLKIKRMEKEAMRKRSVFDVKEAASFLQSPRKALWVVFGVAMLGFLLVKLLPDRGDGREAWFYQKAENDLNNMAIAMARYHFHTGQWPSTNVGLIALSQNDGTPGWNGPYINNFQKIAYKELPPDPWKNPYVYRLDANGKPVLFSQGTNGVAIFPDSKNFIMTDVSWTNEWVTAEERCPRFIDEIPQRK